MSSGNKNEVLAEPGAAVDRRKGRLPLSFPLGPKNMNVTEQDIKALKKTSSKGFLLFFMVFMPLVIIFFLVMAGINFWFCHKWASAGRLTISEVFCIWFQGISPSMNYSGIVLMAIQRLQTALSQIVLAIVFGIVVWTQQKAAGRNARILKFIQENRIQPER